MAAATTAANGNANGDAVSRLRDTENYSDLQLARLAYSPTIPGALKGVRDLLEKDPTGAYTTSHAEGALPISPAHEQLASFFPSTHTQKAVRIVPDRGTSQQNSTPLKIGLVLSGGQAPGGHNVIAGLLDHLQAHYPGSQLLGFLNGPRGILNAVFRQITPQEMDIFRNQGGFDMICSGRDKIESLQDLQKAAAVATKLELDGIVVAGGDDSNTNAAVMAEYFASQGMRTSVIGVPKTIDGDLKNSSVAVSFGFDTACKVYSELIGNIMIDAASAGKYWHWIRLMGRAASHITLECALQTHPQIALISEEIASEGLGLAEITKQLADIVQRRSKQGRDYGVALLPEGLIEFVPEVHTLIAEINEILARFPENPHEGIAEFLTPASRQLFELLPIAVRQQLLLDRDPHGNVQVAKIETERLLLELVTIELARRKQAGTFKGKFNGMTHYMGYEGRASLPTNFDATYCYALGHAAGALLATKQTGLMATIYDLHLPSSQWQAGGTPLVSMMAIERRKGKDKPVISKALVELSGEPFKAYASKRAIWALEDCFRSPGPIQFYGGGTADAATFTLALEINEGQNIRITSA